MIKEKALLLLNKRASSNGVRSRTLQFLLSAYSANVTVPPLLDDNGAIASSPLSERSPEFPLANGIFYWQKIRLVSITKIYLKLSRFKRKRGKIRMSFSSRGLGWASGLPEWRTQLIQFSQARFACFQGCHSADSES